MNKTVEYEKAQNMINLFKIVIEYSEEDEIAIGLDTKKEEHYEYSSN